MRVFSFAQESTRYCNYSKNKFGNELTFVLPSWCNFTTYDASPYDIEKVALDGYKLSDILLVRPSEDDDYFMGFYEFFHSLQQAEENYMRLINRGWKAQEARAVLPNCLKTELIMTGFVSDWQHFFDLRALGVTGAPHPDAKALAESLHKEFIAKGYLK